MTENGWLIGKMYHIGRRVRESSNIELNILYHDVVDRVDTNGSSCRKRETRPDAPD